MVPVSEMPHVVVVGAGFGGVSASSELAKEGFRVTLIDRHPYNTFQPLLYQVATGGLNAGEPLESAVTRRGRTESANLTPRATGRFGGSPRR